jgi:hypothetical protein
LKSALEADTKISEITIWFGGQLPESSAEVFGIISVNPVNPARLDKKKIVAKVSALEAAVIGMGCGIGVIVIPLAHFVAKYNITVDSKSMGSPQLLCDPVLSS